MESKNLKEIRESYIKSLQEIFELRDGLSMPQTMEGLGSMQVVISPLKMPAIISSMTRVLTCSGAS